MKAKLGGQVESSRSGRVSLGVRLETRFLLRAALLMVLLYGAYYFPYDPESVANRLLDVYLAAQAQAAGALIGLFDTVSVTGRLIGGRFPLQIVKSCSSLDAQALYVAAVLAFPSRWSTKLLGLVAGVLTLTTLNLLRIAGLYFVGAYTPSVFDALHEELLPLVLVASACVAFALWARWARGDSAVAAA